MNNSPVYFIFSTTAIGGAEKRFLELWWHLKRQNRVPVFCFLHESLMQAIRRNDQLQNMVQEFPEAITLFTIDESLPAIKFQQELSRLVRHTIPPEAVLHYVLMFPAFVFSSQKHRTLYSLTESSLKNVNIKGRLFYWLCAMRSNKVDILDPTVFEKMRSILFFKRKNLHHTPGSFVDARLFCPAPVKKKQLVFLGRFFYVKQITRLIELLPDIYALLLERKSGIENYEWLLLGYGQEESTIRRLIEQETYRQIPIRIEHAHQPETYLAHSTVIFSLQLRNNYPSKSLLEGMAAGNIPVVTDVGDTRKIAAPSFSYYVPEQFNVCHIAEVLHEILSLNDAQRSEKMQQARQQVVENFTIDASLEYYEKLYRQLAQI